MGTFIKYKDVKYDPSMKGWEDMTKEALDIEEVSNKKLISEKAESLQHKKDNQ